RHCSQFGDLCSEANDQEDGTDLVRAATRNEARGAMNRQRLLLRAAVLVLLAISPARPATAQPAADFYRGRQVTMIIGSSSGGGYDTQGRLVARHLGRKIPGNPTIVVQNMPGAGSISATNHLYNAVPRDGSVFALLQREMLIASLISPQNVRFDISK